MSERVYLCMYSGTILISFPKSWDLQCTAKAEDEKTAFKFKRGPAKNGWLIVWPEHDRNKIYFRWQLVDSLPRGFKVYDKGQRPPTIEAIVKRDEEWEEWEEEDLGRLFGDCEKVINLDELFS